jgi:glycine cleavage system H protein
MIPDHLKYTAQHEWALITETGTVRFGITDHAQDALGDIVFVTLPEPGSTLTAYEACARLNQPKVSLRSMRP